MTRLQGEEEEEDAEKLALKSAIKESMSRQRDETFAALTFAARAGDVEMVRNLLRHGADINGVDYDGRTALAQVKKIGASHSLILKIL